MACQDPMLLRNTVMRYSVSADMQLPSQRCSASRQQLVLRDIPSNLSGHAYQSLCRQLHSLSLHGTEITECSFMQLLNSCEQLEVLDLSACNSLFLSGRLLREPRDVTLLTNKLQCLKELNLSSIHHLTDATFNRIVAIAPNLQRLMLAGDRMLFHSQLHAASDQRRASSTVLTFKNVSGYVHRQAAKLTSLDLSRTNLTDEALVALAHLPDLQLRELRLVACKELTDSSLQVLCEHQGLLEVLDISESIELTDSSLYAITTHLSNLRSLNLEQVRRITDNSVSKLRQLSHLEHVSLASCAGVGSAAAVLGLCQPSLTSLTSLNLKCVHAIDNQFVIAMCKTLPLLDTLDLSSCSQLTDVAMHHISAHLAFMKYLQLAWCKRISDFGLLGLEPDPEYAKHAPDHGLCKCQRRANLTINLLASPLPEKNYPPLDPGAIDKRLMAEECVIPISNLSLLRSLNLSACLLISDISVIRAMHFHNLQVLRLEMCPLLTDEGVIELCARNRTLEELHLPRCKGITDKAVVTIASKLPRLTTLDVSVNSNLTNSGIYALQNHSSRLRLLDVSMCRNITISAIEALEQKRTQLMVKKRMVGGRNGEIFMP